MLRYFIVLFILLSGWLPLSAQLNAGARDSLRSRLASTADAKDRLGPLKEMAWSYLFSEEALPYLHELDSLTLLLDGDPDRTVRMHALAVRSSMFYQRGYQAKFRRHISAAQKDFREALHAAERAKDTLAMANAMNALGVSYAALRMPSQALHWYNTELALILSTANRPPMYVAHIRQHKAEVLMHTGRLAEADQELAACDTLLADRYALTLMGRGQLAGWRGDTTAALSLMARAAAVVDRSPQPWDRMTVWEPYARFLLQARLPDQALRTAQKAIDLADHLGDHAAQAGCLVIAGQAAMQLGDDRVAEKLLSEAMSIAKEHGYVGLSRETGDDGSMLRAAELLGKLYRRQDRIKEALWITDQWVAWKDSLRTIEDREELLRFDLEQATLTDSILDAQRLADATNGLSVQIAEEREGRLTVLIIGGAVLTSVLMLLVLILGRRKRERIVAQHALQHSRDEHMIRDLKQRERLSEDLHEELGAGLSALKLWSELDLAEETDPRKKQLLQDRAELSDELVTSLRQIIWAMNSPAGTVQNLVDYLNDSAHFYCAQHSLRLRAQVDRDWPTIILTADQRRDPFLVLKEALANTVKHSGGDTVHLRMYWRNGLHLEIQDNGIGIHGEIAHLPGNGLRSMKRRIMVLGGSIHFDGTQGMRIEAFLPLSATR